MHGTEFKIHNKRRIRVKFLINEHNMIKKQSNKLMSNIVNKNNLDNILCWEELNNLLGDLPNNYAFKCVDTYLITLFLERIKKTTYSNQ